MKVLMINKFLYPNGGSETYMFELGKQLERMGHEVQYFGMEHEGRCVGNRVDAYTGSMDFHGGSKLTKLTYPLKTIYSSEARQKLRLVLDDFRPDVIHLNNFNYQLTPSIILEADKWRNTPAASSTPPTTTSWSARIICAAGWMVRSAKTASAGSSRPASGISASTALRPRAPSALRRLRSGGGKRSTKSWTPLSAARSS